MTTLELLLTRLREAAEHDICDVSDAVSDWLAGKPTEGMVGWEKVYPLYDALVEASHEVAQPVRNGLLSANEYNDLVRRIIASTNPSMHGDIYTLLRYARALNRRCSQLESDLKEA